MKHFNVVKDMFNSEPLKCSKAVLKQWKKLKPFQLEKFVNNETIFLNPNL